MPDYKKEVPPVSRRVFLNKCDEIAYLCDKAFYYLHIRRERYRARRFIAKLSLLIASIKDVDEAIIGKSSNALILEYEGNWKLASYFRKQEVELIFKLFQSFRPNQSSEIKEFALRGRRKKDVISKYHFLKISYDQHAGRNGAIEIDNLISEIENIDEP